MIEFVGFWGAVAASFALGWVVRRAFFEAYGYGKGDLDLAYVQGVADERAASRKRGQELASAIEATRVAPYTGRWPS